MFLLARQSNNERSLPIKLCSGYVTNIFRFLVLNTIKLEKLKYSEQIPTFNSTYTLDSVSDFHIVAFK